MLFYRNGTRVSSFIEKNVFINSHGNHKAPHRNGKTITVYTPEELVVVREKAEIRKLAKLHNTKKVQRGKLAGLKATIPGFSDSLVVASKLSSNNPYINNSIIKSKIHLINELLTSVYWTEKKCKYLMDVVKSYQAFVARIEADKEREKDASTHIQDGRYTITGKITSAKIKDGYYGNCIKVVIQNEEEQKFYGSVPSKIADQYYNQIDNLKGSMISIKATVKVSNDSKLFAWMNNPRDCIIS